MLLYSSFLNNGVGAGSGTAHRYWRVRWVLAQDAGSTASIALVEMYTGVFGGQNVCTGGIPIFSGQDSGAAANAFDADLDNIWADTVTGVPGAYIGYDFGVGNEQDVKSVLMQARSNNSFVGQSPASFAVEWSDDNVSWTPAFSTTGQTWTTIEAKLYRLSAPAWTSFGSRRHWRGFFHKMVGATSVAASIFGIAEMELRTSVGGADQTGSGTASSSGDLSATFDAAKAFDNNSSTFWTRGGGVNTGQWLAYDMGAGNDIDVLEIALRVRPDAFREDPASFRLQASSDGVNWETVYVIPLQSTWTAGEQRVFTLA